jgi:hypothetical protein
MQFLLLPLLTHKKHSPTVRREQRAGGCEWSDGQQKKMSHFAEQEKMCHNVMLCHTELHTTSPADCTDAEIGRRGMRR